MSRTSSRQHYAEAGTVSICSSRKAVKTSLCYNSEGCCQAFPVNLCRHALYSGDSCPLSLPFCFMFPLVLPCRVAMLNMRIIIFAGYQVEAWLSWLTSSLAYVTCFLQQNLALHDLCHSTVLIAKHAPACVCGELRQKVSHPVDTINVKCAPFIDHNSVALCLHNSTPGYACHSGMAYAEAIKIHPLYTPYNRCITHQA